MITHSGVEHEFHTTVCRELISLENIRAITPELEGAQRYFLRQYRDNEKIDEERLSAYPEEEIYAMISEFSVKFPIYNRV